VAKAWSSAPPGDAPLRELVALADQCVAQARKEGLFDRGKPANWLDWPEVQRCRVHAERKLVGLMDAGAVQGEQLLAARDVLILVLVTFQPPDRVGVHRLLQLGVTLRREGAGFRLALESPNAHKTAAYFGPTNAALGAKICECLVNYIELAGLVESDTPYIFYAGTDPSKPISPSGWTKVVKSCFERHSGVPLAPKELRAAFVTHLKSSENDDRVLKAAAVAMRHSSKMQDSAAYNKDKHDRLVSAAVKAAEKYASRFMTS
jgi:hypothetical protein